MVVAGVDLIKIRDKFDALADNEEEDNKDQDSCHVPFLPDVLGRSGMRLGRVSGDDDNSSVEDGDGDVGTQFNKHKFHPEHVDCNVGGVLNKELVNYSFPSSFISFPIGCILEKHGICSYCA